MNNINKVKNITKSWEADTKLLLAVPLVLRELRYRLDNIDVRYEHATAAGETGRFRLKDIETQKYFYVRVKLYTVVPPFCCSLLHRGTIYANFFNIKAFADYVNRKIDSLANDIGI